MQMVAPKPLTILSILTSASLAIAAVIFGASRDFGMFILGIQVIGGLLILALIIVGVATVADRGSRGVKISAFLVLLTPFAAYAASHLRDRVLFVGWSLSHPAALQAAMSKDSIITTTPIIWAVSATSCAGATVAGGASLINIPLSYSPGPLAFSSHSRLCKRPTLCH